MAVVTINRAEVDGDDVMVAGAVDGTEYQAHVWKSHLDGLATKATKVRYCAEALKAVADRAAPRLTVDLAGTVTV